MLPLLVAVALTAGDIHGTLLVPQSEKPVPVVVIIAGSGPTDRDGNNPLLPGKNNSLKLLAEELERAGIASLRYDKRGIGESAKLDMKESDLRFENYIDDAAAWVTLLRKDPRFSRVIIAGHSEGSLLGIVAAQRGGVDRFVSISGVGRPADEIIIGQLEPQLPPEMMKQARAALASLKEGKTVTDTPRELDALFRPSVQPYLISWFKYDPAKEIAKLKIPVLVIHGAKDSQVPPEEAKLLSKTPLLIEGMGHLIDAAAVAPAIAKFVKDVQSDDDLVLQFFPSRLAEKSARVEKRGGPAPTQHYSYLAADLDGSGTKAYLVASYTNGFTGAVRVLKKDGKSAQLVADPQLQIFGVESDMQLKDLDADGRPEVIAAFSSPTGGTAKWIFRWTGAHLTFLGPSIVVRGREQTALSDAAFEDIDGDGKLEIINPPSGVSEAPQIYSLRNGRFEKMSPHDSRATSLRRPRKKT